MGEGDFRARVSPLSKRHLKKLSPAPSFAAATATKWHLGVSNPDQPVIDYIFERSSQDGMDGRRDYINCIEK